MILTCCLACCWLLYAYAPGVGPRGGRRMTADTMIDRFEKLHRAENLCSCSYSAFCTYIANRHHAFMMSWIGRCEEPTDSVWRLLRWRLGSQPPWSEGACLLANLPLAKHTSQQPTTSVDTLWHKLLTTATMVPHSRRRRIQQSPIMLADCRMRRHREWGTMAAVGQRQRPWSMGAWFS